MSTKATYNPADLTVKQTFTVQSSLLDAVKDHAKAEYGGNLSRCLQALIEKGLAGPGGDKPLTALYEEYEPYRVGETFQLQFLGSEKLALQSLLRAYNRFLEGYVQALPADPKITEQGIGMILPLEKIHEEELSVVPVLLLMNLIQDVRRLESSGKSGEPNATAFASNAVVESVQRIAPFARPRGK